MTTVPPISDRKKRLLAGPTLGLLMVMLYNILSSTKEVVSGAMVQTIDPIALTAFIFAIVTIFFQFIAAIRGVEVYTRPFDNPGLLVTLNIFSCGSWIGFFYSVSYLEPAIVSALMVGVGPALTALLLPVWYKSKRARPLEVAGSLGILISTGFIIFLVATGNSSLGEITTKDILHGSISALIGSVAMVGSSIFSKKLSDVGNPPVVIMAHRFYLLVGVAFFIALFARVDFFSLLPVMPYVLALAAFGVILPLWALQVGIKNLDPLVVMILISTAPAFTYAIQLLDSRLEVRPTVLFGVALLCIFAIVSQIRWQPRGRRAS